MPPTKPDYGDAGYGEVGCLFIVGGILVGSVVAVVLLPFLPTRLPASGQDLVFRFGGIAALAYIAGTGAFGAATAVVERVRVLWKHADILVFLASLIGAAVVVPLGVYVRVIGEWAGPLSLLVFAAFMAWMLAILARDTGQPPKSPSR